jgi:hypothetical protein
MFQVMRNVVLRKKHVAELQLQFNKLIYQSSPFKVIMTMSMECTPGG